MSIPHLHFWQWESDVGWESGLHHPHSPRPSLRSSRGGPTALLSEPTALALSRVSARQRRTCSTSSILQRRTLGPSRDICVTHGVGPGHPAHSALETLRLSSGRAECPALGDGCAIYREPAYSGMTVMQRSRLGASATHQGRGDWTPSTNPKSSRGRK